MQGRRDDRPHLHLLRVWGTSDPVAKVGASDSARISSYMLSSFSVDLNFSLWKQEILGEAARRTDIGPVSVSFLLNFSSALTSWEFVCLFVLRWTFAVFPRLLSNLWLQPSLCSGLLRSWDDRCAP